jgi:hypothetical protein
MAAKLWQGETTCNLCKKPIKGNLYDARLSKGSSWATMCQRCFSYHGIGLGLGYGQEYTEETNPEGTTTWIKTKG